MLIPQRTWYGYYLDSKYSDRSNGQNPRYGQINPLGPYDHPAVNGRIHDLIIGDVIQKLWIRRYQHGATMQIIKINRKSVIAIEQEGSYSPGARWNLHQNAEIWIAPQYMSESRLRELAAKWNVKPL